jgi:hypothetical protein
LIIVAFVPEERNFRKDLGLAGEVSCPICHSNVKRRRSGFPVKEKRPDDCICRDPGPQLGLEVSGLSCIELVGLKLTRSPLMLLGAIVEKPKRLAGETAGLPIRSGSYLHGMTRGPFRSSSHGTIAVLLKDSLAEVILCRASMRKTEIVNKKTVRFVEHFVEEA